MTEAMLWVLWVLVRWCGFWAMLCAHLGEELARGR